MKFVPIFLGDETHVGLAQDESIFDLTAAGERLGINRITRATQLMGNRHTVSRLTVIGIKYRGADVSIAMGTPEGVRRARGIRLRLGDVMKQIDGIGVLETRIITAQAEDS